MLIAMANKSGRPPTKRLNNVLEEVHALDLMPSDEELEGRRRLCNAAWKAAEEKVTAVLFPRTKTTYSILYGGNFGDEMKFFFNCKDDRDLNDPEHFFELLEERNVIEISTGKPRPGRYDFYTFFNDKEIVKIHEEIRHLRGF